MGMMGSMVYRKAEFSKIIEHMGFKFGEDYRQEENVKKLKSAPFGLLPTLTKMAITSACC